MNLEDIRLFVDMDGTLARFHDEVKYLERMFEKGFFENLKPFKEAIEGIRNFIQKNPEAEVFVLSSTIDGEPPYCKIEKNKWLDKYLPEIDTEHRLFPKMGEDKSNYIPNGITKNDILFDDYNVNLEAWERAGGTSVKCKNNINHKGLVGELWQGLIVYNETSPFDIASNLEMCAERGGYLNYEKNEELER